MRIHKTDISKTETKLDIAADIKELSAAKDRVLKKLSSQVTVPGFRSGKVPLNLVERNVNANTLQSEFLDDVLTHLYRAALKEYDLRPVSDPQLAIKKFVPFTELECEITVQIFGEVKLADYSKIKLQPKAVKVEDKEIDEVITALSKRMAEKKDVTRASKDGDQVWIDFKGTDAKGKPVKGADGKDYPLSLGSNTFIPGFEANVVGMKPGESKTFTIPFPKDYGVKALQGKKVTFEVTLTKVQEVIEPKIDDEFAKSAGPVQTVAELKADIKKELQSQKEREANTQLENELIEELVKRSKVDIPKSLVDEQIDRAEAEEKQNLAYRGQTWQEHLDEEGVTEEEHREQKRAAAEQRVSAGLILSEIAEKEKIEIAPEELESRMQMLKSQYTDPAMLEQLDQPDSRREIGARMMTEKTLYMLVNGALNNNTK